MKYIVRLTIMLFYFSIIMKGREIFPNSNQEIPSNLFISSNQTNIFKNASNLNNLEEKTFISNKNNSKIDNDSNILEKRFLMNKEIDISNYKLFLNFMSELNSEESIFNSANPKIRFFWVLFFVIITIVGCCLGLQLIICVTKDCRMTLNEIKIRERNMNYIKNKGIKSKENGRSIH